jgi:hypothetical protein
LTTYAAWTSHCVALAGLIAALCVAPALAASKTALPAPDTLYGTCFAEVGSAAASSRRAKAVYLQFQGLDGGLLAGVVYQLRYGPTFGFSGDCFASADGGFVCRACAGEVCGDSADSFAILWSGGGSLRLVSRGGGALAENFEGGRDRFASGTYVLTRVAPETCSG